MKKLLVSILAILMVLAGCSSQNDMGVEISLEEVKPIFQGIYENNEKRVESSPHLKHLLCNTLEYRVKEKSKILTKSSMYYSLEDQYYHLEEESKSVGSDIVSIIIDDMFIQGDMFYLYRSTTMAKRTVKISFSCSKDYIYDKTLFGEPLDICLYDYFIDSLKTNLEYNQFYRQISHFNHGIQNEEGIICNPQNGLRIYQNEDLLTLDLDFRKDKESKKYNDLIDRIIAFKGDYLLHEKQVYYDKSYTDVTYDYESVLEIPTFDINDYEVVEPFWTWPRSLTV